MSTDQTNPNFDVEYWEIDKPQPYENNPRVISDEAVEKVAASIDQFGWRQPIVVDTDGVIVIGHTRLKAAQSLGLKQVPVHVAKNLSAEQIKALRLADNRTGEFSEWDEDKLARELAELEAATDLDFDLDVIGWDEDEIGDLIAGDASEEDLDQANEEVAPPENPVAREGDLWILGDHRLACGDSTDKKHVARLLDGAKPHLMVTDPPYGVEYDAEWRLRAGLNDVTAAHGKVLNDDRADWREAWELFPGDVAYVWHAGLFAQVVAESLQSCDFQLRSQIIWAKTRFALSRGHYHWQHEPCWYAVKKGAKGHWHGDRSQATLWEIEHIKSETGHSTQKPIDAMRIPILNNSKRGDAIYEPFCGSGTTLIACELEGRKCYASELSPPYVDVIIRRWQELTGEQAVLDGDGRSFEGMADERLNEKEAA
ncbi:MAG: ParB N-terminal domain-containing protein [Hyphomicrobiaceae bacterium]|nr:ParB N-terminal domain-containing protein [Hyphomicrobiaceae bacterium]